jgi:putative ABC transport system permease protein
LKNGVRIEDATTELNGVAERLSKQYPGNNPEIAILGIHDVFVENVRTGVLVAFGAVVSFLLIACANVANLKLAQGLRRGREIAVRTSLGATRRRIMRQLVTESLMLSVLGGAVGFLLAWATIAAFPAFSPNLFPTGPVRLDWWVLAFNLIVSIGTGILFGILPAWQVAQANLNETIKATGPSAKRQVARRALVVAEVTFSIVLAIAGGLMVRTLVKVRGVDYGFRPENVFTVQLVVPPARYPADPSQYKPRTPNSPPAQLSPQARLYNDLIERLKGAPGVQTAAAVSSLPLSRVGIDFDLPVYIEGRPRPPASEAQQADFRIATADYFKTMQIPILQGRAFSESDGPNTPEVIVINDTLARRVLGTENPIGKRIVLYGRPREIIGVYESVRHRGFRIDPTAEMVVPSRQFHQFGGMTIILRSALDPGSLESLVKRELRQIDPDLPASNARTMNSLLSDSVTQPHLTTILLGSFALLGVVLAAIGLYGVMSYTVSQRIREIGIRMALGARRQSVLRLFLRETLSLAMIGIVCGLAAALGVTRLMRGVLFGVAPSDPVTYAICALFLLLAALVAAYGPARRATRVDPLKALRHE